MLHLIWFGGKHISSGQWRSEEKVGSLGKAEWLDLSIRSLGFLGLLCCKLEWEHFNLLCTGTEAKNTGNTHTGMQPQVEVEGSEGEGRQ